MDNNGTRIGFVITRSRRRRSNPQLHTYFWIATKILLSLHTYFWIATKNYCHYEERSDEVIQSHTCIFWIATKIFDFLAMTSVCVMLNKSRHPEKLKNKL